ncbi:MAG: hypothetical protein ACOYJ1_07980 [Peptococcales bacterium]|jgi:sRNA-binding protein
MVLKAIDMQVLVPRSHDVGKIQQHKVQEAANQIQYAGQEIQRQATIQQNSVNKMTSIEKQKIKDYQGKNKKDNKEQKDLQKEEEQIETEEIARMDHLGQILDIQI